jgi:hypothetical protein
VCFFGLVFSVVSARAASNVKVTPASIAFPKTMAGLKSISETVTIKNVGRSQISIISFGLTPFTIFQLDYGYVRTLNPGDQALFGIVFVPTAETRYTGTFEAHFDDGTMVTIPLSGSGFTTNAKVTVSPNLVTFAATPVGTTVSQNITVTNVGTSKMTLNAIDVQPPFLQKGFTNPVPLDPSQSFSFTLTFRPTSAGNFANTVGLGYDVLPLNSIAVSGVGSTSSVLAVATFPVLPVATQDGKYQAVLNAVGGTAPYTFSLAAGSSLPAGLTLSAAGTISGTVSQNATLGQYRFTVNVSDSGHPQQHANLGANLLLLPLNRALCNRITTLIRNTNAPIIPITDLGTGTYLGVEGGLYGKGSNVRPAAHESAGLTLAQGIGPLDANGNPDPNGLYSMVIIGVSVTKTVANQLQPLEQSDPVLNSKLKIVNAAIDGTTGPDWANVHSGVWQTVLNYFLPYANVSPKQVVVAYVLMPHPGQGPGNTFPKDIGDQENDLANLARNLHTYFPSLKLAYLSSAYYGGYSASAYPEPQPYEGGYAFASVIEEQINGNPSLNYDPAKGPVMAPWLSWGPYIWANGLNPRSDGLTWSCQDLASDGTHPSSPQGRDKTAGLIVTNFKSDDTIAPWYFNPVSDPTK